MVDDTIPNDEILVRSFQMIDENLKLILTEIGPTNPPDEILEVLKFDMVDRSSKTRMGGINLRLGYTDNVVQYRGNIGFTVFETYRGHSYSARSCL